MMLKLCTLLLVSTWLLCIVARADQDSAAARVTRLSLQLLNKGFVFVCENGGSISPEESINKIFVEISDRLPGIRLVMVPDPVGPISFVDEPDKCIVIKRG